MGKNTSVSLGDHYEAYARRKVESGEFATISEVIRDALRRAEERDLRIEHLQALLREGEQSGDPQPFDLAKFLDEMHASHKRSA
ncbi:type II toxin-antitoxin system ParD family antitoxin [Erythrobacter sp. NE805]|uniref:type II toxin-antitoxin system ParD family antitoxin n=1 Tax=Erythrobacter sp. NE805 TaxID=3389875 RepID=UPI00396B4158